MSLAIVPGSFDPITVGHVDIVERAAKIFDTVVVMVMVNREKNYMFSIDKRTQLAKLSCDHLDNVKVLSSEGMLVDVVKELGANAIIKGVRTIKDFKYEQIQAYYNKEHNPQAETLYLPADPKLKRVSSTMVRKMIDGGKKLDGILMPTAIKMLKADGIIKN
ncbi:MAG: pantetheine-phosphate adenylyltransferase [Clostridia bacterium]|nr:pantetheine-phosphate adenylyltransferase [Clostridia bacterium]